MTDLGWLPPLLVCDWNRHDDTLERAYAVFQQDFGNPETRPTFQGRRLGLKRHPEWEGKSATFWHFVTEGAIEAERVPDGRRLEHIGWPRALILESANASSRVKVWSNRRASSLRWLLAVEDYSYLLVLDDRGEFLLPWTAFTLEQEHRRRKLEREYEARNS